MVTAGHTGDLFNRVCSHRTIYPDRRDRSRGFTVTFPLRYFSVRDASGGDRDRSDRLHLAVEQGVKVPSSPCEIAHSLKYLFNIRLVEILFPES